MSLNLLKEPGNPLSHVIQHPLVTRDADLGPLTPEGHVTLLSDQIVILILGGLLLAIFVPWWVRGRKGRDEVGRLLPGGAGNAIEAICTYLREEVARPVLHQHTDRFIKFIWSLFFFVLTMNLLGLLPIAAVTPLFGTHIGGTPTANIWLTGTLALITLSMMVINGVRLGGMDYIKHFNPGPPLLAPLLVPLEILGLFAKAFSLAVRLFANMIAGHVLLAVLLSFILQVGSSMGPAAGLGIAVPVVVGSIAVNMLEIFVAFLQAFIFTFLTALFLGMSAVPHPEGAH
jgi:F-type H+-transporting ATPase subunit a